MQPPPNVPYNQNPVQQSNFPYNQQPVPPSNFTYNPQPPSNFTYNPQPVAPSNFPYNPQATAPSSAVPPPPPAVNQHVQIVYANESGMKNTQQTEAVCVSGNDRRETDCESITDALQESVESPERGIGCHCKAWLCTLLVLFPICCGLICHFFVDIMCRCTGINPYTGDDIDLAIDACDDDDVCPYDDSCDIDCYFPCSFTRIFAAWLIFAAVPYAYYLCEVCRSSSWKYLRESYSKQKVDRNIELLHACPPLIWWRVECYHHETRLVPDGNGGTRTQSTEVVTHRMNGKYQYKTWKDISDPIQLGGYNLTKLTCYKKFGFANEETKNDYNWKKAQFRRMNDRDKKQRFDMGVDLQGFKAKLLVDPHSGAGSWFVSTACYLLSSCFLCTTCFRMYFSLKCERKTHVFKKEVSI